MHSAADSTKAEARAFVRHFLSQPGRQAVLARFEADLGLDKSAIEAAYLRYATESNDSDNHIYDEVGIHVAMWIEYQTPGSIHERRQAAVLEALQRWQPQSVADIGFGAPTRYVHDYVLASPSVTATLVDKYPAALAVAGALLKHWQQPQPGRVQLALHDMDAMPPPAGFGCYLMLDAIEHAAQPAAYLRQAVAVSLPQARFLFHIPIGPQIASHHIAWADEPEATRWLEAAGLRVLDTEFIGPNPAVDFFARGEVTLRNLFVSAIRR